MSHTIYKVNDKRVKSVTTIINAQLGWNKQVLLGWTRKHCLNGDDSLKILTNAGKTGTLAHKMIESFIEGKSVVLDKYTPTQISEAKTAYYGYWDWQKGKKWQICDTEMKMVSEKYKFGGTVDCIYKEGGKYYILDFKTSNSCHDEYIVQLAAYRQLYEENSGNKITSGIILKLSKDKKEYKEYKITKKDLDWGWKVFTNCLNLQELKTSGGYKW